MVCSILCGLFVLGCANSVLIENHNDFSDNKLGDDVSFCPTIGSIYTSLDCINIDESFSYSSAVLRFACEEEIINVESEGDASVETFVYSEGQVSVVFALPKGKSSAKLVFYSADSVFSNTIYFSEKDGFYFCDASSSELADLKAGYDVGFTLASPTESESSALGAVSTRSIDTKGKIYGALKWQDREGHVFPLKYVTVKVTVSRGAVL